MQTQNPAGGKSYTFLGGNSFDERTGSPKKPPTAEAIQDWLVLQLSERLGVEPDDIDIRQPFSSYGLSSREAVSLSGDLEDWLGLRLSPTLVYEHPIIKALARHLAGETDVLESTVVGAGREAETEPIAIIGIGCRFPGAKDPEAFWRLLRDGVDAITEVPAERWDFRAFYDPNPEVPGKMNTRWGGFLEQVDQFDPYFFGISPRETARMDPQQRLLLEVAWEALEDAGQVPERMAGTRTGVFIGISTNDYGRIQWSDPTLIDAYAGTGNALSVAANRLSYVFDFQGPSIAVDTACSSSLVAVHLACSSLWNGESTLALAGGVNLILSPAIAIGFTKAGVLSPDGRCKAFDARANGYVRGEGAGLVVLKPLSRALDDGDPIYAVILGSAVNHDGRSNGLMAPNPQAQERTLREAYRRAGVSPGQVQYVEAHGTGTLLGDPIEAQALGAVLVTGRPEGQLCIVGSVKSNMGHLEAAAGVAGLIKVALSLKHRAIPPSLHFQEPNPHIPFDELPLRVQQTLGPWPDETRPSLAGVSSFGFGGTNAHVVLEESPRPPVAHHHDEEPAFERVHLVPLSAHSPEALRSLARVYQEFLAPEGPEPVMLLQDICYTASVRRSHHDYRLALVGHSRKEVIEGLEVFLQGEVRPGMSSGRRAPGPRRKIVFVFPGQGSQWVGMGRELLEQEPVFRATLEQCDQAMRRHVDWSLLEELIASEAQSRLDEIDVIQPTVFAIEVALAALWGSWGIEPDGVVGHSMGEVAAAYMVGALSLEDAARIICRRSQLLKWVSGQGAMAVVGLSLKQAQRTLVGYEDRLSIAVSNSPTSTVLSGDPAALEEIIDRLQRQDIFCRWVKVDVASHSPQMDPLRAELVESLEGLQPQAASVPLYSTVTGEISGGLQFDASYWGQNLRKPVLFSTAVQQLLEDGYDIFLEISPHPILLSAIQQGMHHFGQEGTVLPSLRRGEEERAVMLGSLGALYALGYPLEWSRLYPPGGRCVRLPSYPWQRERFWLETEDMASSLHWERTWRSQTGTQTNPLLGQYSKLAHPPGNHFWEIELDKRFLPYLDEHRVQGAVVLPISAYIEMVLVAAAEALGAGPHLLAEIEFQRVLFLPESDPPTVQVILSPGVDGEASFYIYSRIGGTEQPHESWRLHATGKIRHDQDGNAPHVPEQTRLDEVLARCSKEICGRDYYLKLHERGIQYGPSFQRIKRLWRCDGEALGELQISQELEPEVEVYQFHPIILDACFQVLGGAISVETTDGNKEGIYLPTRIDRIRVYGRPGSRLWSHARLCPDVEQSTDVIKGDVRLLDENGRVVVEVLGVRFQHIGHEVKRVVWENPEDWLYELQWRPQARPEGQQAWKPPWPASQGSWLIFTDSHGIGEALAALLVEQGERCVLVSPGEVYERVDGEHFQIHPARPEDMRQLLKVALGSDQPACRGVVHLWSLDAPPPEETTVASLEAAQTLGCGSVLHLIQELAQTEWHESPRLWLVTRGAQPVEPEPVPLAVAQAPLWGFGRVIAGEHHDLWGELVDLDSSAPVREASALLWEEIWSPEGEDQIAFRQGQRYVARLVRKRQSSEQALPFRFRPDGSYLITGGLGALGLQVARWMVAQGARRLILMGRTKLPPRAEWNQVEPESRLGRRIAAVRELEALGASIHLASVDVADEAKLASFLEKFHAEGWPPIRGVVHLAAVIEDRTLLQLDIAALNTVLWPKVIGGWLLHRMLEDAPLDFFILFSSAASLLGQTGQGNYAAANAFLDALAHHRRAQGWPGLSIDWGAWAGLGFAATAGGRRLARRLEMLGIGNIPVQQGMEVLGWLLREGATQVLVLPVDWLQYRQFYPAGSEPTLLSHLIREEADASPKIGESGGKESLTRDALLAAKPEERQQLLETYLRERVARVLGIALSKLDVQQPLNNLGLDSMMAMALKNRIEVELGVTVPVVKFLEGPSVAQLTPKILESLTTTTVSVPAGAEEQAEKKKDFIDIGQIDQEEAKRLLARLDQLLDEEVDSLLKSL
jgi:myxalamid-type polyketide synthase MxaE and MxaD